MFGVDIVGLLAAVGAGLLGLLALFVRLWQGQKEKTKRTEAKLERVQQVQAHERESGRTAEKQREETKEEVGRVTEDLKHGRTDHFSSDR